MSQPTRALRRLDSTPLELLQDWSLQLEQNEAQLRAVKTNLARRQLQRKGSKHRRPGLGALKLGAEEESFSLPGSEPPACQPSPGAEGGKNALLGQAAFGGASAAAANSPTLNLQLNSPQPMAVRDSANGVTPRTSTGTKKPFGHPLRYPSQSSPVHSPALQLAEGRGLFGGLSDDSPGRKPAVEPLGHAKANSLLATPTRRPSPAASPCALASTQQQWGQATPPASPSELPSSRLASPAGGQRTPAGAQLQGRGTPSTSPCPPVSPAKLQSPETAGQGPLARPEMWGQATPSPGQLRPESSSQCTPGGARRRLGPTLMQPAQLQHSPLVPHTLAAAEQLSQPTLSPLQQLEGGCTGPSSSRAPPRSPALPIGACSPGGNPAPSKGLKEPPSASPAKLAADPCPLQLAATQLSPVGLGDFRIKALSAAKSERSRVTFQEGLEEREATGGSAGASSDASEEELFFSAANSAAPSRTTSLRAFPALSGQASPTASSNTVLQRLERTADTLAAVAAAAEAAAASQVDGGVSRQGSEQAGEEAQGCLHGDSECSLAGTAERQQEQQAEGWLARGCRSPSMLLGGLFSSRPASTPGRGDGGGSAASSPIRQRLLSGPATLLGALGWGRPSQEEAGQGGASSPAGNQGEGKGQLSSQPSLPSNPFDMLAADDSCGEASVAASPAGLRAGLGEVQSVGQGAAQGAEQGAREASPTPQPLRRQFQRPAALGADALRSSEVGSSWEAAGEFGLPTPSRIAASKDNPLYDPFGSSFALPVGSPEKGREGGPAAGTAQFLGGAMQSGDSLVLQGSLAEQDFAVATGQLSRRQQRRAEEPGSAGSFAARQRTLEPVLEQANEGESSPEAKPHKPRTQQGPQSMSFAILEQQAEAWAEDQKLGWEEQSLLPPTITAEERNEFEESIRAVCVSPERKLQAGGGVGRVQASTLEPAATGAEAGGNAGTPGGQKDAGEQPRLGSQDAASNPALWQTGLAMVGGAVGAVVGAVLGRGSGPDSAEDGFEGADEELPSMGPLGQALTHSQQQRQQLDEQRLQRQLSGVAPRGGSFSAGSVGQQQPQPQPPRSPFDLAATSTLRRQGSALGLGAVPLEELTSPKVGVDAAYTMPLGFSLLHSQQGEGSLRPQHRQRGQQQWGSAGLLRQASVQVPGIVRQASVQVPSRAASVEDELSCGQHLGHSLSLRAEPEAAPGAFPAGRARTPKAGSDAAFFAAEPAAVSAAFQVDVHSSSESALFAAEAAAFIAGGPSCRRPFGVRQPQQEQQMQQQHTPEGSPVRPGVGVAGASPADVFKRGLSPLKVQFGEQDEGPPSASVLPARPQNPHKPAQQQHQQRWQQAEGAGVAPGVPPPLHQPASPDVSRVQPQGKRYSPESLQYRERLKHQGEVISSLYLRRQLSDSQQQRQAPGQVPSSPSPAQQPPLGLRDSASFHTAHATLPRSHWQQPQQEQVRGTPDAGTAGAQAAAAASPTPLSKLRPPQRGQRGVGQGEGSMRFCTPQSSLQNFDPSASQQGGGSQAMTPGDTPAMTPITAINKLRGMAHGSAWEGQQQQMQSILSRLESRVRETRTRAKTEAERRAQLEQQVAELEAQMANLAHEAVQASTLKQELSGAQDELERLRQENIRLQQEREAWEAKLAGEQQRLQAAPAPSPTKGTRIFAAGLPLQNFTAAGATDAAPGSSRPPPQQPPTLPPQQPEPSPRPQQQQHNEPASLQDAYPTMPNIVAAPGPRFPAPSAPRTNTTVLRGTSSSRWEDSALIPPGRRGAKHSTPPTAPAMPAEHLAAAAAPPDSFAMPAAPLAMPAAPLAPLPAAPLAPPSAATMPLPEPTPESQRYPDPYACAVPWQAQQAERGRWSNGSAYSDPTTELWHSMAPQRQRQQQQRLPQEQGWQEEAPRPRGRQHHTWDQGMAEAAGYRGQAAGQFNPTQAQPPHGSTWGPPATPHGRSLQRLLHVAGDSSMFRPLYTGAQQMDRSPRYGTL